MYIFSPKVVRLSTRHGTGLNIVGLDSLFVCPSSVRKGKVVLLLQGFLASRHPLSTISGHYRLTYIPGDADTEGH